MKPEEKLLILVIELQEIIGYFEKEADIRTGLAYEPCQFRTCRFTNGF
jgi:hypothetical protein